MLWPVPVAEGSVSVVLVAVLEEGVPLGSAALVGLPTNSDSREEL